METGDDGLSGKPVTSHVVTVNKREREHAVILRQNMTGTDAQARIHSTECAT